MKEVKYKLESELCADFISIVTPKGWRCYQEQHGFDIYAVTPLGHVGIEAKLKLNLKVITQVLPSSEMWNIKGPDFRAVLVPEGDYASRQLCERLGITVLTPREATTWMASERMLSDGLRWFPTENFSEPQYASDSVAGSPCPVTLTQWKQRALRLIARIDLKGFVTRLDFKELHIDPRRWTHANIGWLVAADEKGSFRRGDKLCFDKQHPTAFAKILEEEAAALAAQPKPQSKGK